MENHSNMDFCHLHLHTEHSLLDGYGTAEQYAAEAERLGFKYLACTDHGNVDGLIKFQKACKKHNIAPIMGVEFYIVPDLRVKEKEQRFHLTALITSEEGFQNVLKLLSIANLEGHHYRPRIDPATLLEHREGLVVMSACLNSFILMPGGLDLLLELNKTNTVCLEIMPHAIPGQADLNRKLVQLSNTHQIPLVATNDCHYPLAGHAQAQEMLLAIQRKAKWTDPNRWKFGFDGLHLRSEQEMIEAFEKQRAVNQFDYLQAMKNTVLVAEICQDFSIAKRPVELPKAHGFEDRDETELIWEIVQDGWNTRLQGFENKLVYKDRVEEEIDLICRQNFQRYFLIVWELINWCKSQGIMTGPGRGSVGGSLVAYLMGLTDVDPIKYGLIFARFINPERIDLPDIDMDFEDHRRPEVRKHLEDCYGRHHVASITTFVSMKGRGALRDVARVFDIDLKEVDLAAKAIDSGAKADNLEHTIRDAIQNTPEMKSFAIKYPQVARLASDLEGQTRGYGKHAAGICLSVDDLREGRRCNLAVREGMLVANWDKGDAEHMGLMKLDVLGLSTLSVLNYARKLTKENQNIDIEFDKIPLDDPGVFREIASGHSVGAFQIGTNLQIKLLKEMEAREFNDIVLSNALGRPGPMGSGMADEFIQRRKGLRPVAHIHPRMEPYTKETLGIVVYQEQVMWAMYELAGLPWSVCDKVRKVMGKSKGSVAFEEFKRQFINGCIEQQTLSAADAAHVWDMLATFGAYGFNKSHSVEYSLLGYWTMFLKCKYPAEFMAALLTYGGKDHKAAYINEARRLGLEIRLPRLGKSLVSQWTAKDGVLCAPFTEIKGVGDSQADKIVNGGVKKKEVKMSGRQCGKTKAFNQGFFFVEQPPQPEPVHEAKQSKSIADLLDKIGADGRPLTPEELDEAQQYFDFNIKDRSNRFRRLIELDPSLTVAQEGDLLSCNVKANLIRIARHVHPKIECSDCELRTQARAPVNPSFGRYNLMVGGEAPGPDEDLHGIGFIGKAGSNVLWPEMAKHGLSALMFHVTNICKCYPGKAAKNPKKAHIAACSRIIEAEIKALQPVAILATGNTWVKLLHDRDGGINDLSGTTEWSDRFQCWICWCSHPASVLYGGSRPVFEAGVCNFAEVLGRIGGAGFEYPGLDIWKSCPFGGKFAVDNNNYLECESCLDWQMCAVAASYGDWMGCK